MFPTTTTQHTVYVRKKEPLSIHLKHIRISKDTVTGINNLEDEVMRNDSKKP